MGVAHVVSTCSCFILVIFMNCKLFTGHVMRVLHFRVRMLVILLFTAVNPEPVSVIMPFLSKYWYDFLTLVIL